VPCRGGGVSGAHLRALPHTAGRGRGWHDLWNATDHALSPGRVEGCARAHGGGAGTSEAEVVRNALLAATIDQAFPKPRIPLFDSGNATLAERVDDELAAGFG
jgi:hypothetical protein